MISQLLGTLSGVVIGGAITFLASYVNERSKWNRSQSTRWDERRLQAYSDFLIVTRGMHTLAARLVRIRAGDLDQQGMSLQEGIVQLGELERERIQRWQEVQLLGSPKAVAIGDELNRCTWTLEYFAYGELTGDADWLLIVRDAYRLRKDFSFAARDDLGVTEAGIVVPEWKDAWTPRDHMIEVRRRVQPLPPS
ncbi:hypothetical protein OG874_44005 [Nocardia sp. NBC_00565]|uniref:hypothetical protein n=1 Tax=Nocardia sp. NBC_00565 TaxID=2975993 RepID=UPI002E806EAF|nr:hypothetical protein [Nocardia sp. NBC_00565]WUC03532.1 hypothetical protein OG874_44005 [Nocardia sp. NBC_00565]